MRRIIPISLIGLLLTVCTIGVVNRNQVPLGVSLSLTPDVAATANVVMMTRVAATVSALQYEKECKAILHTAKIPNPNQIVQITLRTATPLPRISNYQHR